MRKAIRLFLTILVSGAVTLSSAAGPAYIYAAETAEEAAAAEAAAEAGAYTADEPSVSAGENEKPADQREDSADGKNEETQDQPGEGGSEKADVQEPADDAEAADEDGTPGKEETDPDGIGLPEEPEEENTREAEEPDDAEQPEEEEPDEERPEDAAILDNGTLKLSEDNTIVLGVPVKSADAPTYTGKEITLPLIVISANTEGKLAILTRDTDYSAEYTNNVNAGTASVKIKGIGSYSGSLERTFTIKKAGITSVTLKYPEMAYSGKNRTQTKSMTVTAVSGTKTLTLVPEQDFTVTYKNNLNIGTAEATIKAKGNFKGKLTAEFNIVPAGTSVTGLTVGNQRITLNWKQKTVNTTGYQLQYSTNKDFSQAKTVTFKYNTTVKKTVKNLTPGQTYYFRIRVYFDWMGTRYLSKWSDTVKKKVALKMTLSGANGKRTIKVINADPSASGLQAAVWTVEGGQDDLKWFSLAKQSDGTWKKTISMLNMKRSGKCAVHLYMGNTFLGAKTFTIKSDEDFLGIYLKGSDSRIDFVQCAVNIAGDDTIGYGHTWPETISCSGLVGLCLTYCGYADFIQNDPLGWGYIGIGNSFEKNLINSLGCKKISGTFNSSNYKLLKAGDILLYDNQFGCHVGIYMGNGYTVEARGPEGASAADDNGWEVAVYNWRTDVIQYDSVYRIPKKNIHYRW